MILSLTCAIVLKNDCRSKRHLNSLNKVETTNKIHSCSLLAATPFPNSFKCFTCDHATDNYNCNRWAEDKWCPQYTNYCMTVHHFTSQGRSKSVTKRCAVKEDCHAVGCRHHRDTGHTECISCCEGMVCNVEVPTNHTNAVFVIKQSRSSSGDKGRTLSSAAFSLTFLTALLLS
ncbi:LPD6B protein, partial [Polyodon spathula]|nr:LPD6B protein [Polyodon spathula]